MAKTKLASYDNIINEYESLKGNMEMLVKKVNHPIMVPICHNMRKEDAPLAFMPGNLDHTNQVMVSLGDNWFADRSVSQAVEIAERRIKFVKERKVETEKEIESINNWFKFTSQLAEESKDLVEIMEEYDEEAEAKWREEHKRKVKLHKEREKLMRQQE